MQAALSVGAERGYEGTTISLVTERAGLPASSVYWHFADKDELLAEAIQYGYEQWRTQSQVAPIGLGASFDEAIREGLAFSARSLLQRPEFWQLGLLLSLQRREQNPEALSRFHAIHAELSAGLGAWYRAVLPSAAHDDALVDDLVKFHLVAVGGLYAASAASPTVDCEVLLERIGDAILELVRRHVEGGPG